MIVVTNTPEDTPEPLPTSAESTATLAPTSPPTPEPTATPPAPRRPPTRPQPNRQPSRQPPWCPPTRHRHRPTPPLRPTNTPKPRATNTPAPTAAPTQPPAPAVTGRIAFSAGGTLHIVNAATGQDTVHPSPDMRQPDFRADGQLESSPRAQGEQDQPVDHQRQHRRLLSASRAQFTDDFHPFWSPDGTRFVYDSLHQGKGNYHHALHQGLTGRGAAAEVTLLQRTAASIGTSPVWMHDDWIAFTGCDYWPGGTGGSKCGIYRMPSWSDRPFLVHQGRPDMRATDNYGGQLLFMSQESGNWEVYIMPNRAGAAQPVEQPQLAGRPGHLFARWQAGGLCLQPGRRLGRLGGQSRMARGLSKLFDLPAAADRHLDRGAACPGDRRTRNRTSRNPVSPRGPGSWSVGPGS